MDTWQIFLNTTSVFSLTHKLAINFNLNTQEITVYLHQTFQKQTCSTTGFLFLSLSLSHPGEANTSTIQRENRRHVYSLFSLFVQYIIPFILITVIYSLIYWFLKQHRMVGRIDTAMKQRARRTNAMLISISLLYCFCWLPLNFFNVAVDIWDPFRVLIIKRNFIHFFEDLELN